MIFYNYIYLDPRKPGKFEFNDFCLLYEPFYVGKGTSLRYKYHLNSNRIDNRIFKNKIKKIQILGYEPYIVLLNETIDESESYKKETVLIREIGSSLIPEIKDGPLLNICLKNEPPSLRGKSYKEIYGDRYQEEIEKRRKSNIKSHRNNPRKHTENTKKKISESISGKKNPMFGKHRSEETKQKISSLAKQRYKEKKHPSYQSWKLTSPSGEVIIVEDGLRDFCEKNNLSYSTLCKCLKTKKRVLYGRTKGWYIEKNI